jgi:hypothetical protein
MTPSHVANDWATITTWLPASSPPTAPWSWREWKSDARFRRTGKVDGSMGLTEAEKVYLSALEAVYPDMRLARGSGAPRHARGTARSGASKASR